MCPKYYKQPNPIHPDMEAKSFLYHFRQEYAAKTYFMAEAKARNIVWRKQIMMMQDRVIAIKK